jgi:hypothetical protein
MMLRAGKKKWCGEKNSASRIEQRSAMDVPPAMNTYCARLQPEIKGIAGKARGFVIHHTHLGAAGGEYRYEFVSAT